MSKERELTVAAIDIEGIVQGVGFRPFLHGLGVAHGLTGWILNRGNAGVRLEVEGPRENIKSFIKDIELKKPVISRIDKLRVTWLDREPTHDSLEIKPSENAKGPTIVMPADIATCDACLQEMRGLGPGGKNNKYYQYPFVACAQCGPRFTTVIDLPYDRERTTMVDFPLCRRGRACIDEYMNPHDRRFHAQTFACPTCGPHYYLSNSKLHVLSREMEAIKQAARKIERGHVIAMKGIGGVHLVVDASNTEALETLRNRKGDRKTKPFAVMAASIDVVKKHARVPPRAEEVLASHRRPIVLLRRLDSSSLSQSVAPGLSTIGFMLPYMGSHHLLLDACAGLGLGPLVFTSGNASGMPMAISEKDIVEQLEHMADFFLLHDRRIYQRCDDSVGKVLDDGTFLLIRRSRGFVPEYVPSPLDTGGKAIIAVGPELHATATIFKGNKFFVSQYIGDVVNLETLEFLDETISHFSKLLRLDAGDVACIACDAHPGFHSTALAREKAVELGVPLVPVFHHEAHCAALCADRQLDPFEDRVYITCDGVGYGRDGKAWGGEFFVGSLPSLERAGHLRELPMPGGDRCVRYPGRMLAVILAIALGPTEAREIMTGEYAQLAGFPGGEDELDLLLRHVDDARVPRTTSTGRILDAASVALGACGEMTYEGEPAIRLEGLGEMTGQVPGALVEHYLENMNSPGEKHVLDFTGAILELVHARRESRNKKELARHAQAFQRAVGLRLAGEAIAIASERGVNDIGFCGGVSLNRFIFAEIKEAVQQVGFRFFHHDFLPPGDGGISTGQALAAWSRLVERG